MKKWLSLFIGFVSVITMHAQMRRTAYITWEDFVEEYMSDAIGSENSAACEEQLQRLESMVQNPLQINRAERTDFLVLPFVSAEQVDSILSYRRAKRGFVSLGELQLIRGLDYFTRRYLSLFVRCDSLMPPDSTQLERVAVNRKLGPKLHKGKHTLETRLDVPLYRREGYRIPESPSPNNYFTGNALHHTFCYRYTYRQEVAYGLTLEKDAGEPIAKRGFYPYDHLSGYFMMSPQNRSWSFVIGDYEVRGGRGLLWGSRNFAGREALLSPNLQLRTVFRPHTSTDESRYFRGVAVGFKVKHYDVLAFVSFRKVDARFEEGTDTVRTLLTTGLHRTIAEVERRHNLSNFTSGLHVAQSAQHFGWSADAYFTHFGQVVWPEERNYNLGYFRGQTAAGVSLSYYLKLRRLRVEGEVAADKNLYPATEHRLGFQFSPRLVGFAQLRHFNWQYVSLYGEALQQASRPANEQGLALGLRYVTAKSCEWTGYVDIFRYPKPTFSAVLEGAKGLETAVQAKWRISAPWQLTARYRLKTVQHTITGYERLEYRTTHKLRLSVLFTAQRFSLTAQADGVFAHRQTGMHSLGWLASMRADVKANAAHRIKAFVGLFFTDDYNSVLYAYEPQLLHAGAFPSFAYHGARGVLLYQCKVLKKLHFGVRVSTTRYFNRAEQSSGVELIRSAWKNDVSMQLTWHL